ncbi:MAG: thioesterase family protein [Sandaracinaceae bacterium]|nr:thioesterase family protein [Sandaracinaceae bacterium]
MSGDWRETHRGLAHAWMCDHFGHVNVRFYAHFFDDAGFALWSMCGVTRDVFGAAGVHTVVARTETDLRAELRAGQPIAIASRFERLGQKSVTYRQVLRDPETGRVHAEQRAVEVFFDPVTRTSRPIPDAIRALLEPP